MIINDTSITNALSVAIGCDAKPLFDVLNKRGIIYGGFILHCLGIARTNDIDVACNSKKAMREILKAANSLCKTTYGYVQGYFDGSMKVATKCAVFPNGFKLDVTLVQYENLADFVEGADMDYIAAGYSGSKFACNEDYWEVLRTRQCISGRFVSHNRIAKALSKGFNVGPIASQFCHVKPCNMQEGVVKFRDITPIQLKKDWYDIESWPEIACWL
jgi:hypothetical protein